MTTEPHGAVTKAASTAALYPGHPLNLSFVAKRNDGGGLDCWNVMPISSYITACMKGRELGQEYLAFVGQYPTNGNVILLSWIVASMLEKSAAGQNHRGLAVGFFAEINRHAIATAALLAGKSP